MSGSLQSLINLDINDLVPIGIQSAFIVGISAWVVPQLERMFGVSSNMGRLFVNIVGVAISLWLARFLTRTITGRN